MYTYMYTDTIATILLSRHEMGSLTQDSTAKLLHVVLCQCHEDLPSDFALNECLRHELHTNGLEVFLHNVLLRPFWVRMLRVWDQK